MRFIVLIFTFFAANSEAKSPLGDLVPICDIKDPKLNSCVVNSANLMVPIMAKGIKDFKFPPVDPLFVPRMDVGQNSGPVNLKLELINTTHLGISTMRFRSASIDTKANRWVLNGTLPDYSLEGKYTGNGRILLVPIVGDGRANFTFRNTGIDFVLQGTPKEEKGNVFFVLKSLRVYFVFDKAFVSLTNLFDGNPTLGAATNRFLNENSGEVVKGLQNTLEDIYSALYMNLVKRITSNVPYNQLFSNVSS